MKILIAHNYYGDNAIGGESMVFKAETDLLLNNKHEVLHYVKSNSEINNENIFRSSSNIL